MCNAATVGRIHHRRTSPAHIDGVAVCRGAPAARAVQAYAGTATNAAHPARPAGAGSPAIKPNKDLGEDGKPVTDTQDNQSI